MQNVTELSEDTESNISKRCALDERERVDVTRPNNLGLV